MAIKEIFIKIRVDSSKDEFGNIIEFKGFDNASPIQNTIELIGLLEFIKQQEVARLFEEEKVRGK